MDRPVTPGCPESFRVSKADSGQAGVKEYNDIFEAITKIQIGDSPPVISSGARNLNCLNCK